MCRRVQHLTLGVIVCLTATSAFRTSQAQTEPLRYVDFVPSNQADPQTIRLYFDPKLEPHIAEFKQLSELSLNNAQRALGLSLLDPCEVYFDAQPDDHNGLATVIPRNRIVIHTEPPDIGAGQGFGKDYLVETLSHEFTHLIYLQQRRGLFNLLDFAVGNLSRPLGSWPRWMHEGLAVWSEGQGVDPNGHSLLGRTKSGLLEWDLRKYSEYKQRTKKSPLSNSDLDGFDDPVGHPQATEARKLAAGTIPYHFGTQLVSVLHQKVGITQFIKHSASSLGISWRIQLRDLGLDPEELWAQTKKSWDSVPIALSEPQSQKQIHAASVLRGPFRSSRDGPLGVWIFTDKNWAAYQIDTSGKLIRLFAWNKPYFDPVSLFVVDSNRVIVTSWRPPQGHKSTVLNPLEPLRLKADLFSKSGEFLCEIESLPIRLRELRWGENALWGISTNGAGSFQAQRWTLAEGSCQAQNPQILLTSRSPFERISNLAPIWNQTNLWVASRSHGRDSTQEQIVLNLGPSEQHQEFGTWVLQSSQPLTALETSWDARSNSLRMFLLWTAMDYWGAAHAKIPLQILRNQQSVEILGAPWIIGPTSLASNQPDQSFLLEKQWDADRLISLADIDYSKKVGQLQIKPLDPSQTDQAPPLSAQHLASHSHEDSLFSRSLIPQFVIPGGYISNMGTVARLETFGWNVEKDLETKAYLGWNLGLQKPVLGLDLAKSNFLWGPFSSAQWTFTLDPIKDYESQIPQTRGVTYAHLSLLFGSQSSYFVRITPSLSWIYLGETTSSKKTHKTMPALAASWTSKLGIVGSSSYQRVAHGRTGLGVFQKLRWITNLESKSTLLAQKGWGEGQTLRTELSLGWTSATNSKFSYFTWGSGTPLASVETDFNLRGYPGVRSHSGALGRWAVDYGFPLARLDQASSWNRFRVSELDAVLTSETVWINNGPQWLPRSNLGLEAQLHIRSLGYLSSALRVGYFYGVQQEGEHELYLGLSHDLDLPF